METFRIVLNCVSIAGLIVAGIFLWLSKRHIKRAEKLLERMDQDGEG